MKMIAEKGNRLNVEMVFSPDGQADSGGVFNEIVDYLNGMLAAAPPPNLNLGEIHFLHKTVEEDVNYDDPSPHYINKKASDYEATGLTGKLKIENSELKLKVARLIAQLNDMECSHDSLRTENGNLKTKIDNLQLRLENFRTISRKNRDKRAALSSTVLTEAMIDEHDDVVDSEEIETAGIEAALNPLEEPKAEEPVEHIETQAKLAKESRLDSDVDSNPSGVDSRHLSTTFDERVVISRPGIDINNPGQNQNPVHKPVVFSKSSTHFDRPAQNRFTSKILKHDRIEQKPAVKEKEMISERMPEPSVDNAKPMNVTQDYLAVNTHKEKEPLENSNPADVDETLQVIPLPPPDVNESDLEPVDPTVNVHQHMKNYKTIQQEADSLQTNTGHTIVL